MNKLWKTKALEAIRSLAKEKQRIHPNDIQNFFIEEPSHPNHWGIVWLQAMREGIIIPTEEYIPLSKPQSHGRRSRIYLSTLNNG